MPKRRSAVSVTNVFVTQFQFRRNCNQGKGKLPLITSCVFKHQPSRRRNRALHGHFGAGEEGRRMKNLLNRFPLSFVCRQPVCLGKDGLGRKGKPLTSYRNVCEARDAARYEENKFEVKMTTDYCSKCGQWHVRPVECDCTDSEGESKLTYKTSEGAQKTKAWREEQIVGLKLSIIKCAHHPKCYHLTKKTAICVKSNRRGRKTGCRREIPVRVWAMAMRGI
jgi:hypothetical protein